MFPDTIETDSLRLEPLHKSDVFEVYERLTDARPEVFEHVPQEPHAHPKETREMLDRARRKWEAVESAQYAVRPSAGADAGAYAGMLVLACEWERQTGRVGLILLRPFWGRGYAGECLDAMARLALDRLRLDCLRVGHVAGNENSRRAIERFVNRRGGEYDDCLRGWVPMDDALADEHQYALTDEQYNSDRTAGNQQP